MDPHWGRQQKGTLIFYTKGRMWARGRREGFGRVSAEVWKSTLTRHALLSASVTMWWSHYLGVPRCPCSVWGGMWPVGSTQRRQSHGFIKQHGDDSEVNSYQKISPDVIIGLPACFTKLLQTSAAELATFNLNNWVGEGSYHESCVDSSFPVKEMLILYHSFKWNISCCSSIPVPVSSQQLPYYLFFFQNVILAKKKTQFTRLSSAHSPVSSLSVQRLSTFHPRITTFLHFFRNSAAELAAFNLINWVSEGSYHESCVDSSFPVKEMLKLKHFV